MFGVKLISRNVQNARDWYYPMSKEEVHMVLRSMCINTKIYKNFSI
jgi:hypothetical protein